MWLVFFYLCHTTEESVGFLARLCFTRKLIRGEISLDYTGMIEVSLLKKACCKKVWC